MRMLSPSAGGRLALPDGPPRRVAVLRALQLGDLLCAVPALRALRRALPGSEITLVGLPWAAAFARRFAHLVDAFVPFPGFPGLPEIEPDLAALPGFVREMQAMRYDAVVQLHGRGDITNVLVASFGARVSAGFVGKNAWCPDAARYAPWPDTGREIQRLLSLVDFLGIPRVGTALEFPLDGHECDEAAALLREHALVPGEFVCVHPGARLRSRRWPVERFAALAQRIADLGFRVVVTGGPDERALAARVAKDTPGAVDLAGRTSLGVLGALLCNARLLVCNDTGASHVAAAVGTPSVVLCCGADPWRFAPLDAERHEVLHEAVACRPCAHECCPIGHPCALRLSLEHVAARVLRRLALRELGAPVRAIPAVDRARAGAR